MHYRRKVSVPRPSAPNGEQKAGFRSENISLLQDRQADSKVVDVDKAACERSDSRYRCLHKQSVCTFVARAQAAELITQDVRMET